MKVFDWIASHADRDPNKLAQTDWATERTYTYAQMHERVGRIAGFLRDEMSVGQGDRVAMLSLNSSDVFDVLFACARLGAIFCPLNNRLAIAELDYIVQDLDPSVLFSDREFEKSAGKLEAACPHASVINIDSDLRIELAAPVFSMIDIVDSDIWIILYTSGTTGMPKGVCLHHGMILANIAATVAPVRLSRDSVNLCFMPLFHTGGLNIFAIPCFYMGGMNITLPKFEAPLLLTLLGDADLGISHFIAVPAVFQMLAAEPGFAETDFSHIVSPFIGGAPAAPALLQEYAEVGLSLIHGYGMTEAGPMVIILDAETAMSSPGSCGKPAINMEVRLVRKDGAPTTGRDIGEIWLRGQGVTRGYWRNPEATAETIKDGWLHTGDAAYKDKNGFYVIADRWKNMYISGGENVYPAEVEKAIYGMPEVFEVAVLGVPDEKWGETGVAYITVHPGAELYEEGVLDYCRENLARYKVPSQVVFVEALPHNATGKILKHRLAAP